MALSPQVSATIYNLAGQWAFHSASKISDNPDSDEWEIEFESKFIRYCTLLLSSMEKVREHVDFWKQ